MRLKWGLINKLTGSCLITFTDRAKYEKQIVDIGLNIKNFTKQVHIPGYVRFVAEHEHLADNQYDEYTHNQHARGARHMKKHWEYSQECFDVIAEYQARFPEFIEALTKTLKMHKQIVSIDDLFGKKADESVIIPKIR